MTTELAQRMKAAAIRAKAATEDYVANRMSISVCLSECAEFNDLSDGPDNIIELVEALEAAEKRIAELESRTVKLPAACADDEYFIDGVFQALRYERDVERALAAAGISVAVEGN